MKLIERKTLRFSIVTKGDFESPLKKIKFFRSDE